MPDRAAAVEVLRRAGSNGEGCAVGHLLASSIDEMDVAGAATIETRRGKMHKALFVGIEAEPPHQEDVAEFLRGALESVEHEPDTRHWYALRFGPADFAIFDTFPGNAGRLKHLLGQVGRALVVKTFTILNGLPEIEPADILALKLPAADVQPRLALHVPLEARDGAEEEVARFLQGARSAVEREPGTLSWYALRLGKTRFAILDTFADEAGREAHLSGEVGTALSGSAAPLFAEPPQIHRAQILAFKIASAGGEQRTSVDASAAPVA